MNKEEYRQSEAMMIAESLIISNIYIDINFLKYIELGRILSSPNLSEQAFNNITSFIKSESFVERKTNEIVTLFKNIPDIKDMTARGINDDVIYLMSPSFDNAEKMINTCITHSDMNKRQFNIKTPNKVFIDITPIQNLSDEIIRRLENEYSFIFETPVEFIKDFKLYSKENKTIFDSFFISDLAAFNEIMIDKLNQSEMISRNIFCQKLLPISKMPKEPSNEEYESIFHNIELVMTASSKFHFISPFPCIKGV